MEMLFLMIPAAVFLGGLGLFCLVWAVRTGQFEDMEGPKYRIFFDDEDEVLGRASSGEGEGREER